MPGVRGYRSWLTLGDVYRTPPYRNPWHPCLRGIRDHLRSEPDSATGSCLDSSFRSTIRLTPNRQGIDRGPVVFTLVAILLHRTSSSARDPRFRHPLPMSDWPPELWPGQGGGPGSSRCERFLGSRSLQSPGLSGNGFPQMAITCTFTVRPDWLPGPRRDGSRE